MISDFSDRLVRIFDELGEEVLEEIVDRVRDKMESLQVSDDVKSKVEDTLRDAVLEGFSRISDELIEEASHLASDLLKKSRIERTAAEKKTEFADADKQELIKKIDDLTYRLNRLFNLIIKFEPRIQVLPVLEEKGEASIEELSVLLNIEEPEIREFIEYMEKNGFVRRMPGNRYRLTRSITR